MAIIPSNTQFRGDTTGVPVVEPSKPALPW